MERRADVVVIGGGIAGCSAAYNLAKRGAKVVLVEKGEIASESSGWTYGGIRVEFRDPSEIPVMAEAGRLWESLEKDLRADVEHSHGGCLYIAQTDEEVATIEKEARECNEAGLECHVLSPEETKKLFPLAGIPIKGGKFIPKDGHANPVKTVNAFANAAREYGAKIYTGCTASQILVSGGRVEGVLTTQGEVRASAVVCTGGVWTARLAEKVGVHVPLRTIRGFVAETEPIPPSFKSFVRTSRSSIRQTASGSIRFGGGLARDYAYDINLRLLEDLRLWFPVWWKNRDTIHFTANPFFLKKDLQRLFARKSNRAALEFPAGIVPKVDWRVIERRKQVLYETMPSIKGIKVQKAWGGYNNITLDILPVLGPVGPKGFVLGCFTNRGFTLGPATGKLIAELVLDGKTSAPLDCYDPNRFAKGKKIKLTVYK